MISIAGFGVRENRGNSENYFRGFFSFWGGKREIGNRYWMGIEVGVIWFQAARADYGNVFTPPELEATVFALALNKEATHVRPSHPLPWERAGK
jgi:hypothetical protein